MKKENVINFSEYEAKSKRLHHAMSEELKEAIQNLINLLRESDSLPSSANGYPTQVDKKAGQ